MGAVVPGPWGTSTMETDVEVLTKRIEALERDLRRAIAIANEAVQAAQHCTEKAYERGFREGFDRAFEAASPAHDTAPGAATTDVVPPATAADPGPNRANAGLLGWLRRKRVADDAF
jgi:hypothetical protein